MLDIQSIKTADSAEITLLHPATGEPLGASITIAGPEHPSRKRIIFALQRKIRAQAGKSSRRPGYDPEAEAEESIEHLAAMTLGWKGIADGGKEIIFSVDAAIKLYTDVAWIAEQVNTALIDRENFIVDSRTT